MCDGFTPTLLPTVVLTEGIYELPCDSSRPARRGTALYQATSAESHGQRDTNTTRLLVVQRRFKPSHTTAARLNGLLFGWKYFTRRSAPSASHPTRIAAEWRKEGAETRRSIGCLICSRRGHKSSPLLAADRSINAHSTVGLKGRGDGVLTRPPPPPLPPSGVHTRPEMVNQWGRTKNRKTVVISVDSLVKVTSFKDL